MNVRHLFNENKYLEWFYMNGIRPVGYLVWIKQIEALNLFLDRAKYAYLNEYKDRFLGKRCFIVGTGPSLEDEDLERIKDEIIFGVNGLCLKKDFLKFINCFFISDPLAYRKLYDDLPNDTFISSYAMDVCKDLGRGKSFNRLPVSRFNNFIPFWGRISTDATKVIYDYHTVVLLALQFALYTGVSKIYLLGVDCNYETKKIYNESVDHGIRQDRMVIHDSGHRMIHDFKLVQKKIQEEHIPIEIYNASAGGMLNVFPRISLSQLF